MPPRRPVIPATKDVREFNTTLEVDSAIQKLKRRIADINALKSDQIPYHDARVDNVEHAVSDTVGEVFGKDSPQFRRHAHFRIDDGPVFMRSDYPGSGGPDDTRYQYQFEHAIPGAITRIEGLLRHLEEKREDVQVATAAAGDDAFIDPLVPLRNRRSFDGDQVIVHSTAVGHGEPYALMRVDVDHFKRVNDECGGHSVGDEVLKAIASILKAAVRSKGSAYRVGGDEFALLLPNHTVDEATAVAERVRRAVSARPLLPQAVAVTVSVGVAVYPDHGDNIDSVSQSADAASYDAKHLGRDLVRIFGESAPAERTTKTVHRKQAEPGALTEQQREKIRADYFRTRIARCPVDRALLDVQNTTGFGQKRDSLYVSCPQCGLSEQLN